MNSNNRIVAMIFAVLFVCFAAPGLLVTNLFYQFLTTASYKQAFEENGVYAKAPHLLAEVIVDDMKRSAGPKAAPVLAAIRPAELGEALRPAMPEVWVREAGSDWIDAMFADIRGEEATPVVPLSNLKRGLMAKGSQAFHTVAEGKPDCTPEQLAADTVALVLVCKLPPQQQQFAFMATSQGIQSLAISLPDLLPIQTSSSPLERSARHALWSTLHNLANLMPFLAAASLAIVLISAIRGGLSELRWLGGPLCAAGAVSLVLGAAVYGVVQQKVRESFRVEGLGGDDSPARRLLADLADTMLGATTRTVLIEAAVMLALGGLLLLAARRVEARRAARLAEELDWS